LRLRDNARSRLSLAPESLAEELSSAVANTAGREVSPCGRMAANQTRAEQQLIRDEHCLMRNE
jgi:hypothetical protein